MNQKLVIHNSKCFYTELQGVKKKKKGVSAFKDRSQDIYNWCIAESTYLIFKLSHWYLLWISSQYLQIFTENMPAVRLDTSISISLEKFEECVNLRSYRQYNGQRTNNDLHYTEN